jgi:predicted dehydrogenase
MKLGFIGFGSQAKENIIPACSAIFGVEIVAVCDIDSSRHREAKDALPSAQVFKDYREMMDVARPDAVIAACYPTDHFNIAMEAMARRIAVFIEKPLAPSSGHVERLIETAARKGVTTGVGMNFRFAEVTQRLAAISGNEINSITLRQHANKPVTTFWDYSSILRSFLHAQTIHGLDFLIHLCGPVRNIRVANSNRDNVIIFTVILEFESGAHGTLITSNTSPHFVFDFDVICREKVHVNSSSLWHLSVSEIGKAYHGGETKKWRDQWAPSPLVSGFERSGYHGQFVEFLNAVRQGRDSSVSFASMKETYRCMDIIEALCYEEVSTLRKMVF